MSSNSIKEENFRHLRESMQELNYMNEQYVVFKSLNKKNQNKTQKFDEFYSQKICEKNVKIPNKVEDTKESLDFDPKYREITQQILPPKIPTFLDPLFFKTNSKVGHSYTFSYQYKKKMLQITAYFLLY